MFCVALAGLTCRITVGYSEGMNTNTPSDILSLAVLASPAHRDRLQVQLQELKASQHTTKEGWGAVRAYLPSLKDMGVASDRLGDVAQILAGEPHGELAFLCSENRHTDIQAYLHQKGVLESQSPDI